MENAIGGESIYTAKKAVSESREAVRQEDDRVDEQVKKSRDSGSEVGGKGKEIGCLMCALGVNMGDEKAESREKGLKVGQKGQFK